MTPTDLQLLERYTETRDAEAFSDLVGRYAGMVYGACLRVTGNAHDAEDATQECFLQLAREAGSVRRSVAGWLHKTATRRALMTQRGEARRRRREEGAARMNGVTRSADQEPTWAEIAPHVDEALAELPEELRDPLVLHFLQRKTQAEVAGEIGVERSTVSRRLDKGLERVRASLRKRGVIVTSALLSTLLVGNAAEAAPAALLAALGKMAVAGMPAGGKAAATGAGIAGGGFVMKKAGLILAAVILATVVIVTVRESRSVEEPTQPEEPNRRAFAGQPAETESRSAEELKQPEEQHRYALEQPEEIVKAAETLITEIRYADYDNVRKWETNRDAWKEFIDAPYQVYTDYPAWVKWICENLKDNPMVSVQLGDVFEGNGGLPTITYTIGLKDGRVLDGNLPFHYDPRAQAWEGKWGLDWHLHYPAELAPETLPAGEEGGL